MFEYDFFDGDHFITFDIIDINEDNNEITVAITEQGKITQDTYTLLGDKDDRYFEYGKFYENKIALNDFAEVARNGKA